MGAGQLVGETPAGGCMEEFSGQATEVGV